MILGLGCEEQSRLQDVAGMVGHERISNVESSNILDSRCLFHQSISILTCSIENSPP